MPSEDGVAGIFWTNCSHETISMSNGWNQWLIDEQKFCGQSINQWLINWLPIDYLFLVFMWRDHIPKLKITFLSEVLLSSDKIPLQEFDVLQCFSNRALLNFQAFGLLGTRLSRRSKDEVSLAFSLTKVH